MKDKINNIRGFSMTRGIYCYIDKKNNEIVYVGQDSNIHKDKRHGHHFQPSRYDEQQINRVLQNNPDRYIYKRLWEIDDCTDNHLNEMEKYYTKIYDPKFSFTEGGDGVSGYKWTDEQKEKISGENHYLYGEKRPEETKKKMRENHARYWQGKKRPEHSEKMKGKYKGENNPNAKYNLWDILYIYYSKKNMFNRGRQPNPCRCFCYKYNGYPLPIGLFHDFITPQIINNLISDALNE